VVDPSFRGGDVDRAGARLGIPVEWTEGRVLTLTELARHADYRGPGPIALGHGVAQEGVLTARIIGEAANTGPHDAQEIKQLWHLTARFGRPASSAAGACRH
jgi:hypothetical protein